MRNNPKFTREGESATRYESTGIWERELRRRVIKKMKSQIISSIEKHLGAKDWEITEVYKIWMKIDKLLGEKGALKQASVNILFFYTAQI